MECSSFVQGNSCDRVAQTKDQGFTDSGRALYAQLDSNRQTTSAIARAASENYDAVPSGFSIIPPYMLEKLAGANLDKNSFVSTYNQTVEMQKTALAPEPRDQVDYHGARQVHDTNGTEQLPGTQIRAEGQPPSRDSEVDSVYDFTGIVRDFYQKEYNRNSIDGQGMKFISTVNYGNNYENAFFNGSQMAYGRPGASSPFKTFVLLDITAHEITHGVTQKEAGFWYFGQSGALHESLSDVFGELIKQYSKNQTVDQADWLVGSGVFKEGIHGKALRDMLHPGTAFDDPAVGKDPQPDSMTNYIQTKKDNGGVHYNSSIPNRAFALFATAVGGHAWDDPGHIWYEARKHAGAYPCFSSFAYQTIEAARKIAHQPDEVEKLQKAWETVGVTPSATGTDTQTPHIVPWQEDPDAIQIGKAS